MQFNDTTVREILSNFNLPGTFVSMKAIDHGHINDTLTVTFEENGKTTRYILQRINTNVFKKPDELMENVQKVTDYLARFITEHGGDASRETLTVYKTLDGKNFLRTEGGDCLRIYNFVEGSYALQSIDDPEDFRKAAEAFGSFQRMLADYPSETLFETIPNFHDTAVRFTDLKKAVSENIAGRAESVSEEIAFALSREADTHILVDLLRAGKLPLRVTHNDTKLNNVLFDEQSRKGLCVVDLDTVMPGLSLYDFGDSIRFGANTSAEDEPDVSKVSLDLNLYKTYTEGYLSAAGDSLTDLEIEYLPFSSKLLTFECGIRFLTDYLNGDTYFHTDYDTHNLVRCRTQFALVADIEKKMGEMKVVTKEAADRFCKRDVNICS